MDRPGRSYEKEAWPTRTGVPLVRPASARHPLSAELDGRIERWTAEEERLLGDRVLFVAAGGGLSGIDPVEVLAALRAGWRQVADSSFSAPEAFEAPPVWDHAEGGSRIEGDGRGLYRHEMVALVRFEAPGSDLDVVYAARALYGHTKALDRHARYLAPR
jgi:hypothetical protein